MWHVRYTNSTLNGKKTRKLTTSSEHKPVLFPVACDFLHSGWRPPPPRHALREYNIHKKLDHIVSPSKSFTFNSLVSRYRTSSNFLMSLRLTLTRMLTISPRNLYYNYYILGSAQCWNTLKEMIWIFF